MRRAIAAISVLVAWSIMAVSASAQMSALPDVKWKSLPGQSDMGRYFPEAAQHLNVGGVVLLGCNVEPDGHLSGCKVYAESPTGADFGIASLRVTKLMQLEPGANEHSLPVPNRIAIPLVFSTADGSSLKQYFRFGAQAALLTGGPLKADQTPSAGLSCYAGAKNNGCSAHPLTWVSAPDLMVTLLSILKVGKAQGADVAICSVSEDRTLKGCEATGKEAAEVLN